MGPGGWECRGSLHLGIKDADGGLNNGDGLVVRDVGEDAALAVLQDGDQVQTKVLRVELRGERVGQALAGACGDRDTILLAGQVADDDGGLGRARGIKGCEERAANEHDVDGCGFVVGHIEDRAGWVAVDQLDAEDLGVGERSGDFDVEIGRLKLLL